jgi:hypothetical protein
VTGVAGVPGVDGVVVASRVTSGSSDAVSPAVRPTRKKKTASPSATSTPAKAKIRTGGLRVTLTVLLIGFRSEVLDSRQNDRSYEKGAVSRALLFVRQARRPGLRAGEVRLEVRR